MTAAAMTQEDAEKEAERRWSEGAWWISGVAMTCDPDTWKADGICRVGVSMFHCEECTPDIFINGQGATWEEAFADAERKEKEKRPT